MNLLFISDTDFNGSGYLSITLPLCQELTEMGHDVKLAGLFYRGQQHDFDFQILPAGNIQDTMAIAQHLYNRWKFDAMFVALDVPLQEKYLAPLQSKPFKYVGIFPIEADPLCFEWGIIISKMDKAFIISEFGTNCALELGVGADPEHLQVGIDSEAWRFPSDEEREKLRQAFGFTDKFVVLTVADNQERKNLTASMDAFAKFAEDKDEAVYVLVTREHNQVGWRLRDYATELGIMKKFDIRERGLQFRELWSLYACADAFLLLSKAEGWSLPVTEAMAVGTPVIGTDCTGIREQLHSNNGQERGFLVPYEYTHRDCFGNGRRYWADSEEATLYLQEIYGNTDTSLMTKRARKHIEKYSWKDAATQIDTYLKSIPQKEETNA